MSKPTINASSLQERTSAMMPLHEFTPSVQKKEMESEIQAVKKERERKGRNISATILRVLLRNDSNISKVKQASFETF